ncbi:MAG: glycosyltransferase family 2 protein [Terracidiphilus sp.]
MPQKVSASVVLYNHSTQEVGPLFEGLARESALSDWVVVNNGGSQDACAVAESLGALCLSPDRNLGYGAAHNLALRSLAASVVPYHLILNPDIQLPSEALADLAAVMDSMPQVGLLMPRVLYPDGSTQYLCKLLPTPLDLVLRRFGAGPVRWLFNKRMTRYDMSNNDYSRPLYVPCLSGCFMFARRSVLESVCNFDERFFLYMEDFDLCRRIGDVSQLLFWPGITVVHHYAQGSYRRFSLLRLHIRAAIKYFNKWGWWRDPVRDARNLAGFIEAEIDSALTQRASCDS